jgi:hypothetical protein
MPELTKREERLKASIKAPIWNVLWAIRAKNPNNQYTVIDNSVVTGMIKEAAWPSSGRF